MFGCGISSISHNSPQTIIEKYPLGINVRIDGEIGLELLESFCNNNKNKQLPFREVVDIFPEYSLDYQLEKLEKIMLE
ncbi:hypothetical protein [Bacteroides uniformis]|uniref:hypothetical protein n=1 Tax=Bacteroides uniformis TaxID=820 RepID=UPI0011063FE1|nr:hypothetical protein [Bacteroides uniformis]MDC1984736.1 hypothetical protein [Bacteroides uniformis]MDC1988627.1 hypothetical protein [Bacteroides uniformis]